MLSKLIREEDAEGRAEALRQTYSLLYSINFRKILSRIPVEMIFPTEDFLEADKLVAVLKAFLYENYRVPIICIESPSRRIYVVDGHHRLLVHRVFNEHSIRSYLLTPEGEVEYYKPVKNIMDLGILKMPISREDASFLNAITILLYYRKVYGEDFYLEHRTIDLLSLVPTQPSVSAEGLAYWSNKYAPITCLEHLGKLYVLDGHTRAYARLLKKEYSVEALVIRSKIRIPFNIVRLVERFGLKSIKDLVIY
ncbi:MAG: hypothetical protein QW304_04205 [Thermoproteota archaeon]